MRRLYRLRTGTTLYSFQDPILEVPIVDGSLGSSQVAAAKAVGAEVVDVTSEDEISEERFVVFDEALYFSPGFLMGALERFDASAGSSVATLPRDRFNDSVILPQGDVPDEWRLPILLRDRARPEPVPVRVPQVIHRGPPVGLPRQIMPVENFGVDVSDVIAGPVPTPFHLLHVNVAVLLSRFASERARWPQWLVSRIAPFRSPRFYAALRRKNRIGKNCRIHPTAVVEGSTLGDGVTVGAHALVRLSHIGAQSTIEDQASVTMSVLGSGNYVANKNHITFSLSWENVFAIHGPYQFSVFGRDSAVFAVIDCDIRLDNQTISLPTANGIVDSNQYLLGNAYGHGSKVGGGNIIAPGRIVPNHLHVPPPDSIVYSFEAYDTVKHEKRSDDAR